MLKTVTFIEDGKSLFRTTSYQGMYYAETLNSVLYVREKLTYLLYEESYGVCDGVGNLLEHYDFENDPRDLVVFLTEIRREDQPEDGGWRWSKWGNYIGSQNVYSEYLYDEPEIESVYVWEAWEIGDADNSEEK